MTTWWSRTGMLTVCAARRTASRTPPASGAYGHMCSRRAAQRDVDQLGQPERSVVSELRDRRERGFGIEVGRALAAKQRCEDLGDQSPAHRSEPDGDVILLGLVGG